MAMNRSSSVSEDWREKGNNFYRTVTDGLSPLIKSERLREAINCYGRALSTAGNDLERSSACKNMAASNWKMATALQATGDKVTTVTFYFKEALRHFQDARGYGQGQIPEWHDSLMDAAVRCWFDVSAMMESWEDEVRMREMHPIVGYILDDATKAREYLEMARHYFHWSVTALGERDFRQCLGLLKECHFPVKEAQRFGQESALLMAECFALENDIFTHTCIAESIQERIQGEDLLKNVVQDEEVLNMDMIWEVVDAFRRAAQMTRDRDLEMEAMALSALGRVFDKVLKLKDRAKACLMKVLELANSLVPRNFSGEDWYEFARSTIERYQREQVQAEEEQHKKAKEDIMRLLKDDLNTLKDKKKDLSKLGFLKFVYATHPPKNPLHQLGEIPDSPQWIELKKMYQRAVIHYHPDKVNVETHGRRWKVLSEEITKLLTSVYEVMKAPPDEK